MNKYVKLLVAVIFFFAVIIGIKFLYDKLSNQYGTNQQLITESNDSEKNEEDQEAEENQETEVDQETEGNQDSVEDQATEGNQQTDGSQEEGTQEIIDFTIVDANKSDVQLSSFVGKPIVVNFWASWCSPCTEELPDFEKAYEKYGDEIEFVMVNMTDGARETMDRAKEFISSKDYTFPVYYDLYQDAAQTYAVYSIPTTYFFDKNGKIITGAQGMINMETLEKGISMIK